MQLYECSLERRFFKVSYNLKPYIYFLKNLYYFCICEIKKIAEISIKIKSPVWRGLNDLSKYRFNIIILKF